MTADVPGSARQGNMRVSHEDRDAVAEQLREAAAEGRLDLDELDARLDKALTAKTYDDLAPLTADLPPPDPGQPLILKGGLHGAQRTGRWQVPARITANGGLGGVKLDFTRAECQLREVEIEVNGQQAGVVIVIPNGWAADSTGVDPSIGGLKDKTTDDRLPGTPLIRLVGTGGMAGVVVRHPNSWERRKLRRNPPR
jgi:hypothetical protein